MYYSVRMRAAQGGDHAAGGRHISGAEQLVAPAELTTAAREMLERALSHSRGSADFIQITVETVKPEEISTVPLLPVRTVAVADTAAGRLAAQAALVQAGVSAAAAAKGVQLLAALPGSMRGAMVLCAVSGERLDDRGDRGIRVSRMDAADKGRLIASLQEQGLVSAHVHEALVLAAKVAAAPGTVAELCWSDDPEYTAGYVASAGGYVRFPHMKDYGDPVGGRVFFVEPDCDLAGLADYLERKPVTVAAAGGEEEQ